MSRREFIRNLVSAAVVSRQSLGVPLFSAAFDQESLRLRLASDPLRPQFHLLPAKNWMNDPNGPIFWRGQYHMFFQYNPGAPVWGDMHWAHAVSPDMIQWRHLPVALAPTPGGADADGCFTGSAVVNHGVPTIIYTGVKSTSPERATLRDGSHNFREVQCLATSADPDLRGWQKLPQPILEPPDRADLPAPSQLTGFRDPFLWQEGETWYLGVASGFRKQGGCVLLYRSHNLRDWEALHKLAVGQWTGRDAINPVDSGEMWECPDFFRLGKKHVLLYSTAGSVLWEVGELDPGELVFHPEKRGILDHGAYYAQKTQLDAKGNRILWGWIPEKRPEPDFSAAGWAGCMALPRVLFLGADGNLEMRFAPAAEVLRGKLFAFPQKHIAHSVRALAVAAIKLQDLCGELYWRIAAPSFALRLNDRAGTWWSLRLEPQGSRAKLTVNDVSVDLPAAAPSRDREFHLYLDASVAELICDRQHALTSRIYRQPDGPLRVQIGDSDLPSVTVLQAWQLRPISRNRLTA